jgi:deazaflavin-dependent oxidoreductase (nitroreductase family)
MEADLVASGRFVRIEMRAERSGGQRSVTVGYVEDPAGLSGAILVAAGAPDSVWARNLLDDPACRVVIGDRRFDAIAEPLEGPDHARTIAAMILRYGTPAERLGAGQSFRLRPVDER